MAASAILPAVPPVHMLRDSAEGEYEGREVRGLDGPTLPRRFREMVDADEDA